MVTKNLPRQHLEAFPVKVLVALALLVMTTTSARLPLHAQNAQPILYRVNAGGPSVSATPNWAADTAAAPSPALVGGGAGTSTYQTSATIDVSHASLDPGVLMALFQSERFDNGSGLPMRWSFPVTPGTYEVRLYFAEIYFTAPGSRVFGATIEGNVALSNYDIVADVGPRRGVRKSFTVTADTSLDVQFDRVVQNPKVSAIEIVDLSQQQPWQAGVSPTSLMFNSVSVGQSSAKTVQVTNTGGSGDPNIEISDTTIVGTDATQFSDNFNDGTSVSLAPGQSTTITVTYSPTVAGAHGATLQITHSGQNSPLQVTLSGSGTTTTNAVWQTLAPAPTARHEIAYVHHNGNFYVTGDRGYVLNEVYTASSGSWTTGTPMPEQFHHAQAVNVNGLFYYLGGLSSPYPDHVVNKVYIFNTGTGIWSQGTAMPAARARAGGGTALYNGKLYVAGGLQDTPAGTGHSGVSVSLFDVYDPAAGTWTALPDMPRPRDHFHAAVVGSKFYVIGGRQGGTANFFNAVYPQVDVFDFNTGTWSTLNSTSNLPTPRAGSGVAVLGQEIIVIGGEGNGQAYNNVDAFNTTTGTWRTLPPMPTARHGIQAAVCNGGIYVVGGGLAQGGSSITNVHEVLFLGTPTACGTTSPPPPPGANVYRVNAGGPALATTPEWSADTSGAPSPYVNASAAGAATYSKASAINTSHPSIPTGTPAALFQTERYDSASGVDMEWRFPVTPGAYEVRLYLAELFHTTAGKRSFDVRIEGNLVLDNYDIVAEVGPLTGIVKSFVVASDSFLNVTFQRVVENPKINAIEILAATSAPGQLGATPSSIAFGDVPPGQTFAQTLSLRNLGGSGSPSIVIDATDIIGTDASQFIDNFDDLSNVTLEPSQSTDISVSFRPTSGGPKQATLRLHHSGTNSPLQVPLGGNGAAAAAGFGKSALTGTGTLSRLTRLQFGPDGRLYVAQQDGLIKVFTVERQGANSYAVIGAQTITSVRDLPNRNDDGTLNPSVTTRLITGLLVAGTATNPVIYVTSSDPRIGAGPSGTDLNLDTNSSTITRLTWTGSQWQHLDLVRGLPRSEENHAANGMHLDPVNNILYVAMGGNTNKGAPSNNFARLPEYALSSAILSINLAMIGSTTYNLPTLDDETRAGTPDANDPFGGNNGLNQAMLVPGGPVQVYAPGFRNAYDVIVTRAGKMYAIDNGGNAGWGDVPVGEGTAGNCTNAVNEPGTTSRDGLHRITGPGYYGGHPNPTRGNTANTFNTSNPQSPVPVANPIECDYREVGSTNGALATFPASTNGMAEYTAGNFAGALQGNLLTASFDNAIYRVQLNADGTAATQVTPLFSTVGGIPLDVDALGPEGPFPGTIWVADYSPAQIVVFEPNDYEGSAPTCTGANSSSLDEDEDGFDNQDEIQNGTNPCSAADVPPDWDNDFTSDRNDPDDDNDGMSDVADPFALDHDNGATTRIPLTYLWENDGTLPGGILNLGFTGLMTNGVSEYSALYDVSKMTAGGAAGVLTVDQVSEGDAFGSLNDQQYAFQLGVHAHPSDTGPFFVHTRILAPFSGLTPSDGQSMGLFVGTGDQDNYAKIVISGGGGGAVVSHTEIGGAVGQQFTAPVALPGPSYIDLYLRVDPVAATVQPYYSVTSDGVTGPQTALAAPQPVPSSWFTNAASALAIGIISTSRGPGASFPATWDFIRAFADTAPPTLLVAPTTLAFGDVSVGQSNQLSVQLTNQGTTALTVASTTITGTSASAFSDNFADTGVTLAPSASMQVTVTFAPATTGTKSATLSIAHSGANSPVSVALSGNGLAPAPTLAVTPGSLAFGDVSVGQSKQLSVQLTNQGTTSLTVATTTITGTSASAFSDNFGDIGVTLAPSASMQVTVTFAPATTGTKSATLSIAHSGANSPVSVALSGNGLPPAPTLAVTPGSLAFGDVTIGQSRQLSVTLTNQGTTSLIVRSTAITGQAANFSDSFDDASDVALSPGASITVFVTFAPSSNGTKKATLAISHSGANSPLNVLLSGSGKRR